MRHVRAVEALIVGRVGVDLYPEQSGVPLSRVTSFRRSLGGTATNVAVGTARLGHAVGVVTKTGSDAFGAYVREALDGFGVDTTWVSRHPTLLTPVVFCALDPPEDPPITFYRQPTAPDLTLTQDDVPRDLTAEVPLLWVTGTGVSTEPARTTQLEMLSRRSRKPGRHTVVDLDWRPGFWSVPDEATPLYDEMLGQATVAVGNRAEVEVAVGSRDPIEAARRILARGVDVAFVKLGADGVLVATDHDVQVVPPHPVEVVCGLGAGDAFGAALVHGLLSGWDPVRCARYANAAGAIVASRLACADAMPTLQELESVVSGQLIDTRGGHG